MTIGPTISALADGMRALGKVAGGALLLAGIASCDQSPTAPEGFLAVITNAGGPAEVSPGETWTLEITELSGTLGIDTIAIVQPNDTLIMSVPPATYTIRVDGVPVSCQNRFGNLRQAVIAEGGQTFTVRYNFECNSLLVVETASDGREMDDGYALRVTDPDGGERLEFAAPNDTIRFDDITDGTYTVELDNVAPNCVVTNDGGATQMLEVAPPRSAVVSFRVRCSDERYRPTVRHLGTSYRNGKATFYMEATDPGSNTLLGGSGFPDIDLYQWNLTDCRGASVLGSPASLTKTGFSGRNLASPGSRLAGAETVRIVMVLDIGLPDAEVVGRCASMRVEDREGNTSTITEEPVGPGGSPPVIRRFNAYYSETLAAAWMRFELEATDPDGDYAGAFIRFLFKDGTFGAADGDPDVGSYGVQGFEGTDIRDLLMRTSSFEQAFSIEDVLSVTVFAVDRNGNATVFEDTDALR